MSADGGQGLVIDRHAGPLALPDLPTGSAAARLDMPHSGDDDLAIERVWRTLSGDDFPQPPDWTLDLAPALGARLRDTHGRASEAQLQQAVQLGLSSLAGAWSAYGNGAAAAIFDICDFIDGFGLTMPRPIHKVMVGLCAGALRNQGMAFRNRHKSPLGAHHEALVQRLRYEVIDLTVRGLPRYEDRAPEPEFVLDRRGGLQWRGWSSQLLAREADVRDAMRRMPMAARAGMVEKRAIKNSYDRIRAARSGERAAWPGPYYLPSSWTMWSLGWDDLTDAFAYLPVRSDKPSGRMLRLLNAEYASGRIAERICALPR